MTGITVTRRGGTLLAIKRADTAGAARLRHEAEVLGRVDHPGLVGLVSLDEGPPVELHTRFAGPESWDRTPPDSNEAVVGGLAAVAAIVADLHDVGVAHRALDPSHVIATSEGRPVLCGLGDAGPADDEGRAVDLEGLADLIEEVRTGACETTARRLASLAAGCRQGTLDPRTLAHRLDALPLAGAGPARRTPIAPMIVALGRGPRAAVAAAVVVAVGLGGWAVASDRSEGIDTAPTTPPRPPATSPAATVPPLTSPPTTRTSAPAPPATTRAPTTTLAPTIGGEAPELVHDGRRYGVGREGDVAVVGDWDCDGTATPAALRLASGTVAVFDRWPSPGETLEPSRMVTVEDAESLESEPGAGCDTLRVRTATGSRLVEVPPAS